MEPCNSEKKINFNLDDRVPLLKILDSTTGLLQFSHLSFQEALAVAEAQTRMKANKLENAPGDFLKENLFSQKAINFLKLCAENTFSFPKELQKDSFNDRYSPQDFMNNVDKFVQPCRMESLTKLDLSSCSLSGGCRTHHTTLPSEISKYFFCRLHPRITWKLYQVGKIVLSRKSALRSVEPIIQVGPPKFLSTFCDRTDPRITWKLYQVAIFVLTRKSALRSVEPIIQLWPLKFLSTFFNRKNSRITRKLYQVDFS